PRVDPALEAICLKCLAKSPGERYASAAALADELEHWLASEPTIAKPVRWPGRVRRTLRRHRNKVALVLVSLVSLAAAGVLILARSGLPTGSLPEKPQAESPSEKEPIELVAEKGGPLLPSRWVTGGLVGLDSLAQDGTF